MNLPCLILLLFCLTSAGTETAGEGGPWNPPEDKNAATESVGLDPPRIGMRFFQRYFSPVDGARCPMHPTCSAYALQSLEKQGPFPLTLIPGPHHLPPAGCCR